MVVDVDVDVDVDVVVDVALVDVEVDVELKAASPCWMVVSVEARSSVRPATSVVSEPPPDVARPIAASTAIVAPATFWLRVRRLHQEPSGVGVGVGVGVVMGFPSGQRGVNSEGGRLFHLGRE